ncbi:MAG: hypothetical protein ACXADS_13840 [Candidatus Thorarchaeota archaeon]|jgi:Flp pilus assembly protein TadD
MTPEDDFMETFEEFQHGLTLMEAQRFKEAEDIFLKLTEIRPNEGTIWFALSQSQSMQLRLGEAEALARRSLELNDTIWGPWNLLGQVLKPQSRFAEAEECFRKAVEISPRNSNSWAGLG